MHGRVSNVFPALGTKWLYGQMFPQRVRVEERERERERGVGTDSVT